MTFMGVMLLPKSDISNDGKATSMIDFLNEVVAKEQKMIFIAINFS
jgi:hypothetical protein